MDPMQNMNMGDKKVCNCPHHKVVPWMIILIGLALVLNSIPNFLSPMWTGLLIGIFLIVIGGVKLNGRKCKCC